MLGDQSEPQPNSNRNGGDVWAKFFLQIAYVHPCDEVPQFPTHAGVWIFSIFSLLQENFQSNSQCDEYDKQGYLH